MPDGLIDALVLLLAVGLVLCLLALSWLVAQVRVLQESVVGELDLREEPDLRHLVVGGATTFVLVVDSNCLACHERADEMMGRDDWVVLLLDNHMHSGNFLLEPVV